MKLRHPWLIRTVALLIAALVRWWMSTLRYRIVYADPDQRRHPADARRERYLYVCWHESMLFPVRFKARLSVLSSLHPDAELTTRICRHLGFGVVRGSSTRGGSEALLGLREASRHSHLAVTPDGPRGPRRVVKLGLVFLASHTGLPVVAFGVGYTRAVRFRSWDRFALPLPWSSAACVVAPTIRVPPNLNRAGLERYRRLVEGELLKATEAAERWAEGKGRPVAFSPPLAA